jgi:hypothetical protein
MANDLSRGSIVLAIYPFTDLSSARRRPALVVSATDRPGRDCILAFITSQPTVTDATDLLLDVLTKWSARNLGSAMRQANDFGSHPADWPPWAIEPRPDGNDRYTLENGARLALSS